MLVSRVVRSSAVLLLALLLGGCSLLAHQVRYDVTGTATSAIIGYSNGSGGTDAVSATLPWTYSFTGHWFDSVALSAATGTGVVTVTIVLDGQTWKTDTNSFQATVSGTL